MSTACRYFEIDPAGKVVHTADFTLPYYTMLHYFAIAGDYAVFNVSPYTSNRREILDRRMPHFMYLYRRLPFHLGDAARWRWQRHALVHPRPSIPAAAT